MQVEAPDHKQLMEFVSNQTDTNPADIVLERNFKLFLNDNGVPVSSNFSIGNNNNITIQFQTKWCPPLEEIKAIAKKYKNLIFKLEACEEFNDFIYEFNSDPNNYFETFRKLSTDEIEKLEENNNINMEDLIEKLASFSDSKFQQIVDEVLEYKYFKEIQDKLDFIKSNIHGLNSTQIDSIYNILKPKPKLKAALIDEDDDIDDEDWM
jgi:thiol-disulfide isomerase/thioredoxin